MEYRRDSDRLSWTLSALALLIMVLAVRYSSHEAPPDRSAAPDGSVPILRNQPLQSLPRTGNAMTHQASRSPPPDAAGFFANRS